MPVIAVVYKNAIPEGRIEGINCELNSCQIIEGNGVIRGDKFSFSLKSPCRIECDIKFSEAGRGMGKPVVIIHEKCNTFSFFPEDIHRDHPVLIPAYGVVVTESSDLRSFTEIEKEILALGLQTEIQNMESEDEETYENAAANTKNMVCETFLGVSRDIRIFGMGFREKGFREKEGQELFDWIQPRFHGFPAKYEEAGETPVRYRYMLGRGLGCSRIVARRLEDGILPILHACIDDGDIKYDITSFVSFERSKLLKETLEGTHSLIAANNAHGFMLTEERKKLLEKVQKEEVRSEETVLYFRAAAVNTASVPRYAWFRAVEPNGTFAPTNLDSGVECKLDEETGYGVFKNGKVYCITRVNGKPLASIETAVLVKPGEEVLFEFYIPHSPIPKERAEALGKQDFDMRYGECRDFWKDKIDCSAQINIPEKTINEMLYAGLLHLDLVTYGKENSGTLAPMIGEYCPIGTESAPIIQFMDSMGWHDAARRSILFFLDYQREDGFIQNFGGYMLETGAALWCIGEHFRYTGDIAWVKQIKSKLLKSCRYLINWSEKNKNDQLLGKGYGMMEGKVADPEDENPVMVFMLNGYSYLGLSRVAEMLEGIEPGEAGYIRKKAEEFKGYIKTAFYDSMGKGPVVPLADGTWCPTVSPWPGNYGLACLYGNGGTWFSHGTATIRDSLLGPLYLAFQEVLDYKEQAVSFMLDYYTELLCSRNVAFSQPYYSMHPWVHLKRGEINSFLKAYYNSLTCMSDRETYTFREHLFENTSPHKTHEEAWFLMQTRWMLYMEENNSLSLLKGIPRYWLEDGKSIAFKNMASYFGPIGLNVVSRLEQGIISAKVCLDAGRCPGVIRIRLPHPDKRRAVRVTGGVYDAGAETVEVRDFKGTELEVVLEF